MMAPGSQTFAEKWRKRQACRRCRRIKVRCEFDSPDSDTCTRCAKAGVECQLNPPSSSEMTGLRSHRRGAKYAWIETKQVYSESQRTQKITELEQIIEDARSEITMLRGGTAGYNAMYSPPPPAGSGGNNPAASTGAGGPSAAAAAAASLESSQLMGAISSMLPPYTSGGDAGTNAAGNTAAGSGGAGGAMSDVVQHNGWNLDLVRRPDCVQAIVDAALLSENDAKNAYNGFRNSLYYFFPLPLDPSTSMTTANQLEALAYIAACAATFNFPNAENLVSFLETVVSDRLLVQGQPTLEIARAVLIQAIFIHSCTVKQLPIHLSSAISIITALDFGGREDLKILSSSSKNNNKADVEFSRRRVETYLSTYIYAASLTLTTGDDKYIKMVPVTSGLIDTLSANVDDGSDAAEDVNTRRSLILTAKMTMNASEVKTLIDQMDLADKGIEDLKDIVDKQKAVMLENYENLKTLYPDVEGGATVSYPESFRTFRVQNSQLTLALNEILINSFILKINKEPPHDDDIFMSVSNEMLSVFNELFDSFIQATNSDWYLNKYTYTRTLLAFPALIRLRLAMWSFDKEFPLDLDTLFYQAKQAWYGAKHQSLVLEKLYPLLELIPKYLNLRITNSSTDNKGGAVYSSSALTLRQVLRDAINGVQTAIDYSNLSSQDNDNVDPSLAGLQASSSSDPEDIVKKEQQQQKQGGNNSKTSIEPSLYPGADASAIFTISLGADGQTFTPSYGEVEQLLKELYKEVDGQLLS